MKVRDYLLALQDSITTAIAEEDGQGSFVRDGWRKSEHEPLRGDGVTCIMEGGAVFERAGCGFSHVYGASLPEIGRASCRECPPSPCLAGSAE